MTERVSNPPFHNPFGALAHLRGELPETPATSEDPPSPAEPAAPIRVGRAVVQLQRAGRGGKEVTVVTHLELTADARERWIKDMKSALGCGGHVDGAALVLQGDQRDRVRAWLIARGVKRVT